MNTPAFDAKQVGSAGIVDDRTYDIHQVQVPTRQPEAPQQQPGMKHIRIAIPANVPDELAKAVWQIGMTTVQRINAGMMVLAFPSSQTDEDGQEQRTIGKVDILLTREEDIVRVLDFANAMNQHNMKILQAAQKGTAADIMTATLEGTKGKDEALRQAKDGLAGKPTIQIAR